MPLLHLLHYLYLRTQQTPIPSSYYFFLLQFLKFPHIEKIEKTMNISYLFFIINLSSLEILKKLYPQSSPYRSNL